MELKIGKKKTQQDTQPSENALLWDEVALDLVSDVKNVSKVFAGLQKQYKKYKNTMELLYKYYLMELEDGTIHDNHSIVTEDKKYKYIFFSAPYENKFYFIIYPLEIEDDIRDKIRQRVNELSIPPKEVDLDEIKARASSLATDSSKNLVNVGIIVVSLAVGSFLMYNIFFKKKEPKTTVAHPSSPSVTTVQPVQPQQPQTQTNGQLSPLQQHYALALAEAECFSDLDKKLNSLQTSGVKVSSLTVNTNSTPQGATCSYNIEEEYTYPAVGTKLYGGFYKKNEQKTINISYQDFMQMQDKIPGLLKYANFLQCLQFMKHSNFVLSSRPALLQADFTLSKTGTTSLNLYNAGKFLYALESVCGYNVVINNLMLSKDSASGSFILNWSDKPIIQEQSQSQPTYQNKPISVSNIRKNVEATIKTVNNMNLKGVK